MGRVSLVSRLCPNLKQVLRIYPGHDSRLGCLATGLNNMKHTVLLVELAKLYEESASPLCASQCPSHSVALKTQYTGGIQNPSMAAVIEHSDIGLINEGTELNQHLAVPGPKAIYSSEAIDASKRDRRGSSKIWQYRARRSIVRTGCIPCLYANRLSKRLC